METPEGLARSSMEAVEDPLVLSDAAVTTQDVTIELVPYIKEEVCVKEEPTDIHDDMEDFAVKEEYEPFLAVHECDIQNEKEDSTEEHNVDTEASAFTSCTTMPYMEVMKSDLEEKNASCRSNNNSTNGGMVLESDSNLQDDKSSLLGTLHPNFDGKQMLKEISSYAEKDDNADKKNLKNLAPDRLKDSQSQIARKLYECTICGKSYTHPSNRRRHMAVHSIKPYRCEICGKMFSHFGALKEHKVLHVIGEQQLNKVQRSSIMAAKDAAKSLKMHDQALSKSSVNVEVQKNKVSSKTKKSKLPNSKVDNVMVPKFNKFKAAVRQGQTFACNICDRKFSWHYLLKRHKQLHLNARSKLKVVDQCLYSCNTCKTTYHTKYNLIRHELTVGHKQNLKELAISNANQTKPSCSTCNKTFTLLQNLKRHKKTRVHKLKEAERLKEIPKEQHSCVTCGKSFATVLLLQRHKLTHVTALPAKEKKMNEVVYPCHTCKTSFAWPSDLRKHLLSAVHISNVMKSVTQTVNDQRNFSCKVCGKQFASGMGLNSHRRNTGHDSEMRNIPCDACGIKFRREGDLTRHKIMVGHFSESKSKPQGKLTAAHSCDSCGKTFPWAYQLNVHKLAHMKKKYLCNICGKYFAAEYLLKRHKVVHSKYMTNLKVGKLPHVKVTVCTCNICGEKFAQLSRLRKHKSLCHGLSESLNLKKEDSASLACKPHDTVLNATALEGKNIEPRYTCKVCFKSFFQPSSFSRHKGRCPKVPAAKQAMGKPNVKNQNNYSCDVCGKMLSRLSDLSRHKLMTGHHSQLQFEAPGAGEHNKMLNATPIKIEKNKQNTDSKMYACSVCHTKFSRICDLSRHRNKAGHSIWHDSVVKAPDNNPKKSYCCGTCRKSFSRQNDLRRHIAVTNHAYEALTPESGNSSKINKYSKNSFSGPLPHPENLKKHNQLPKYMAEAHNLQEAEPKMSNSIHPCHTCGKTFAYQYQLKIHKCLQPLKKYSCTICDRHFAGEYLLKRHKLLHAPLSDKIKVGQLKRSIKGTYSCLTCGRVFSRQSDLSRHINVSKHIAVKSEPEFSCRVCNKYFGRLCDLKRHQNTSGHQPYTLNMGERKISQSPKTLKKKVSQSNSMIRNNSIDSHTFNVSTSKQSISPKKNYQCKTCNKIYSWSSGLNRHRFSSGH